MAFDVDESLISDNEIIKSEHVQTLYDLLTGKSFQDNITLDTELRSTSIITSDEFDLESGYSGTASNHFGSNITDAIKDLIQDVGGIVSANDPLDISSGDISLNITSNLLVSPGGDLNLNFTNIASNLSGNGLNASGSDLVVDYSNVASNIDDGNSIVESGGTLSVSTFWLNNNLDFDNITDNLDYSDLATELANGSSSINASGTDLVVDSGWVDGLNLYNGGDNITIDGNDDINLDDPITIEEIEIVDPGGTGNQGFIDINPVGNLELSGQNSGQGVSLRGDGSAAKLNVGGGTSLGSDTVEIGISSTSGNGYAYLSASVDTSNDELTLTVNDPDLSLFGYTKSVTLNIS